MSTPVGIKEVSATNLTLTVPESRSEAEILTPAARALLAELAARFEPRRRELLERRKTRLAELRSGKILDFLAETSEVRSSNWKVAPIPKDLLDRRVEIT